MPRQRPHASKQDYRTPPEFLAAARRRLGIAAWAHDFAADAANTVAASFFDRAADALSVPNWAPYCGSGWGWLNPEFARIGSWSRRCLETKRAGGSIALLVPASVGSNWFRDTVDRHALVLLLNGRLAFIPGSLYPKDCVLALYSPRVRAGYEVWDWPHD